MRLPVLGGGHPGSVSERSCPRMGRQLVQIVLGPFIGREERISVWS